MFQDPCQLLRHDELPEADVERMLTAVGLVDWRQAHKRLVALASDDESYAALSECLPMLLSALTDAATPDGSLINFDRFAQSVPRRAELFQYLSANPRAVEILVKLFVGSQFLTEILLRNPTYLERLTQHKRLAEFKSRPQFVDEAREAVAGFDNIDEKFDALRRFQRWELLRIGACDSFGLMDLKTVTVQLSLLADSIVQSCLAWLAEELDISPDGFAILAFGKLGGEELNYSSDIDLVFVATDDAAKFWPLGQRLIKTLITATAEGFLYRTDMRLRPWGRSGELVTSVSAYVDYLKKHGRLWEKQALLKARVIAGDMDIGNDFLKQAEPLMFHASADEVRLSIREMKDRIEAELKRQGRKWGQVKSGAGSIRDIEFVTQFLQLAHGKSNPAVRSFNTLDGLLRLADFGCLQANEYRQLTSGYGFLRTIEHSLQLMHHKQTHALPDDERELAYLARRLDFLDAEQFLSHYHQHCTSIRAIYDKHIGGTDDSPEVASPTPATRLSDHIEQMEPSYTKVFTAAEIERHAALIDRLSNENLVEVEAARVGEEHWQITIVGLDQPGNLSIICGLLFVYGFDIFSGTTFVDKRSRDRTFRPTSARSKPDGQVEDSAKSVGKFVDVFTVRPPLEVVLPEVWTRYKDDLTELFTLIQTGQRRAAQGALAKRVAVALREATGVVATLYPVDIMIDNSTSQNATVLHIRAEDTIGFLYEMTNALALAGVEVSRLLVGSIGNQVFDTLYVTDESGNKITDENRQRELRATIVLIAHFTHLLPHSPNPEAALLHFRELLEQLFKQPDWLDELSSLERFDVLDALARLLGVSDFLWEDFLRLQHSNLFPVVKDIAGLNQPKDRKQLDAEVAADLESAANLDERRRKLNEFKDREMFRTDMRHILGHVTEFGQFSAELTDVAEAVVSAACDICLAELQARYGQPLNESSQPCPLSVCALGKCGGRELGFASDIELMFVYDGMGKTTGPEVITTTEFFLKLVETFTQTIRAKRKGIFEIDLRLRPYGRAGSLAVTFEAFQQYFSPEGAAWPYERQALVKLRPVAGDAEFGNVVVAARDELIYTGEPFDVSAMRAMREKQVRQLVQAGSVNAKLSPGGLVDCEYLIQGLQITHGHETTNLRTTNTDQALAALNEAGVLPDTEHRQLREAYIFHRRLIDALRMVRGDARDLTVPPQDSEEFQFLARRLGYANDLAQLSQDFERMSKHVRDLDRLLEK